MSENYLLSVGDASFKPNPTEPILKSIFQQYERVLIESLITSFGLDFLTLTQHGGDVDTIHNVRLIGQDEQMTYKNSQNQQAYEQRGEYSSHEYHSDPAYIEKNRRVSAQKKDNKLVDAYTSDKIAPNQKSDLDHVISAKEIHDDPGRVLAGLSGTDLANSEKNLQATNPHTNRTKKADSMSEFLEKHGDEYSEKQKSHMRNVDAAARKDYEAKLAKAYYTSSKFAKDLTFAATKEGVRMGARQAIGFVFAEMWFAVKEEFQNVRGHFDLGDFLCSLGYGLKRGFERAQDKYSELFSRFLGGTIAGGLSSLTTTLCNIFFTTSKNVIRIIRQSFASLVEAGKTLFINPENYTFGDRMRAVVKILATGASVVVGVIISDVIKKTPIGLVPIIGDIVPTFCGSLVTGIMSCTLLYFFDRNELMQRLFKILDSLPSIETTINYYRQQAELFDRYAAELMNIDLAQFKKEVTLYETIATDLKNATTENELNGVLRQALRDIGVMIPWNGYRSFDQFMSNKSASMVFE